MSDLQSAWLREVQRRHMQATVRRNTQRQQPHRTAASAGNAAHAPIPSQAPDDRWRAFERTVRPAQPRFAEFSRYGHTDREVPQAVLDDLTQYFERMDADNSAAGTQGPITVRTVSAAEFARLPQRPAGEMCVSECSICLKALPPAQPLTVLPCAHAFHAPCLRKWLTRAASCPMCREDVLCRPGRQPARTTAADADGAGTSSRGGAAGDRSTARATSSGASSSGGGGSRPQRAGHMAPTAASAARAASTRRGAAPSPRRQPPNPEGLGRTADGGVVLEHHHNPPQSVPRPPQVPPDAELLIVQYPAGIARIWRAPLDHPDSASTPDIPSTSSRPAPGPPPAAPAPDARDSQAPPAGVSVASTASSAGDGDRAQPAVWDPVRGPAGSLRARPPSVAGLQGPSTSQGVPRVLQRPGSARRLVRPDSSEVRAAGVRPMSDQRSGAGSTRPASPAGAGRGRARGPRPPSADGSRHAKPWS